jgi:ATP-dependent RNA helicase DHX8/PRP22
LSKADAAEEEEETVIQEEEAVEEDVEIELVDDSAPFLRGRVSEALNVSPVRIVKNPDGSLQRAAMTQSELAKERRELRNAERDAAMPKDMNDPWMDPMHRGDKVFAQDLRNTAPADLPAWKKASLGGNTVRPYRNPTSLFLYLWGALCWLLDIGQSLDGVSFID